MVAIVFAAATMTRKTIARNDTQRAKAVARRLDPNTRSHQVLQGPARAGFKWEWYFMELMREIGHRRAFF